MHSGKIELSEGMIDSFWQFIDGNFTPIKIEFDYLRKIFIYYGRSIHFKNLKVTDVVPTYIPIFNHDAQNNIYFEKFELVK